MAGLRPAPEVTMPALADCNSPAHWRFGRLNVFNSAGSPQVSRGGDQFHLGAARPVRVDAPDHLRIWIESTWLDDDGALYGWYHHEPDGICGGALTAPQIGAVVSYNNGRSFHDLGIVLDSGDPVDCTAANGFFAGGHGDFSVILDRDRQYFYFLFGNYGGDASSQGVAIARMKFEDRTSPAGAVWKYSSGGWDEPGLGGRVTPIFPAAVSWQLPDTDSLWGPSIHWNTYLESYAVLLNRSCCRPMWPQDGVYASFNRDLADPGGWTKPQKIISRPGDYYPQVLGLEPGGTDTLAGQVARFYVHGRSRWEIFFQKTEPFLSEPTEPELPPEAIDTESATVSAPQN
jgi:hypothetical protein